MTKKLKPSEDPKYFEYEPNEDNVPDDEMFDYYASSGMKPEELKNKKERAAYTKFLETWTEDDED